MLKKVDFRADDYGSEVARLLAMDGAGQRPMPLAPGGCAPGAPRAELKAARAGELFAGALSPEGAFAGLFLYFSCLDEAHSIAQDMATVEGSYWHGIMHRQEPDAGNAKYWFNRVGRHAIFERLAVQAASSGYDASANWDPFAFIDFCESARRRPGSKEETMAMQVQLIEWQLLFDYCGRPERAR